MAIKIAGCTHRVKKVNSLSRSMWDLTLVSISSGMVNMKQTMPNMALTSNSHLASV